MDKYKKVRTSGRLLGDFGVFDAEFGAISCYASKFLKQPKLGAGFSV